MKPDWHKHWDSDPGHITGIQNDKIYSILSAASEETRASEMNVEASEINVDHAWNLTAMQTCQWLENMRT